MPKLFVIQDDSLNAFASGISTSSYTITLSTGIIEKLNDEELQAVMAHELTHILNRDARLLIISIIFVGIFSFLAEAAFRVAANTRSKKNGGMLIAAILLSSLGFLLAMLIRFALSRKREYMADAGAVELTHNSNALANALQKVASDPYIEAVTRKDIAQLFIQNPQQKGWLDRLFTTHPPIERRIAVLRQF